MLFRLPIAFSLVAGLSLAPAPPTRAAPAPVDFTAQVRPILAENCFPCHGFDEHARQARLRLDVRASATQPAKSGLTAIVPGRPADSELLHRLTDGEEPMPPLKTGKQLAPAQIEILRRWIAEGAEYQPHWSLVAPQAAALPAVRRPAWPRNPIDHFVLARLEAENLSPAPEADRSTLLRRVAFDLTGLPPAPAALEDFLRDSAPDAYERAVDRLLASPAYGERRATDWLDAARYADSNGFFRDNTRQIWPWRDWVIHAFNRNQPFDQFTVEQLAGDLLPASTEAQRIATGFNRNHMVTGETGVIDEEYRVEYVADRLETTATVWLGLTLGCARCHDHKYDPISQRDYYRLFAFFNSGVEKGLVNPDDPPPVMEVTTPAQRAERDRLRAARQSADAAFRRLVEPAQPAITTWESTRARDLSPPAEALLAHAALEDPAAPATATGTPRIHTVGSVSHAAGVIGSAAVFDGMQHLEWPADLPLTADRAWTLGVWVKATGSLGCILSKIEPAGDRRGIEILWAKGQLQINLVDRWVASAIEVIAKPPGRRADWSHVVVAYDGSGRAAGLRAFVDGRESPLQVVRDHLTGPITNQEPLRLGRRDRGLGFYGQLDEPRLLGRSLTSAEIRAWYWSERLPGLLATAPDRRDPRQQKLVLDGFIEHEGDDRLRAAHQLAESTRETEEMFRAALPQTLVMQEADHPPVTRVLRRGQYDAPLEIVRPAVPEIFPPLPAEAPRNRLGLARWLTAPEHPLTARVTVNRFWQQCFGEGLVTTGDDFGVQGDLPRHRALLDWLAVHFVRTGWDVKQLLRLMVTSATYRQASPAAPALRQHDPDNRLFARGPKFRLSAEMIRDQALAVSGLLVDRLGGPPVKPYQPPGLWEAVSYNGELTYEVDRGENLWRRTLYTHWKRTAPPPGVQVFDGPTRETCVVRRPRTNTPQQALLLLNDETYVEAARALAAQILAGPARPDEAVADALFARATLRPAVPAETAQLVGLFRRQHARFAAAPASARQLLNVGQSPRGRDLEPVALAAWTVVAHAILNLDEVLTRR